MTLTNSIPSQINVHIVAIEYFENKNIAQFENEVGLRVPQSSIDLLAKCPKLVHNGGFPKFEV